MAGSFDPDGREVAQRACAQCGAGLRRGGCGGVCDPCSRSSDIAQRLREAGFFSREPVRRVLAALDFGYLFRAVRRTAGLTQVELGEVLELDQDRISRIERGQRQLRDFQIIVRVAVRLGIPPMLLGFSADTTSMAAETVAPAHDLHAEPAPGADSLTPMPGSDDLGSLLTESARNTSVISEIPYSGDDGIAEYLERQPESLKSHLGDGVTRSPSLTQFDPAGDVAALLAATLALVTAAAHGVNAGREYNELVASLRRLVDRMNRRNLLQLFGFTTTTAFASPWLEGLDADELGRVMAAIFVPERVDAQVIAHIESILFDAFLGNDKLGPQAALHTVLAQQKILQTMIAGCPAELRPRLLSVFGQSLRVAGWISFNADDLSATRHYYEQARVVAHDAQDEELATIVLANLSHATESSGNPAMSVDYAVAAQTWAARAHHPCLSAFASDIGACAFAAMGDYNTAMRHLENTQTYLPECSESQSAFYTYSGALHVARRGKCLLKLDQTADAIQVISESLKLYDAISPDSSLYRNTNIAVGKLELSAAHVQAGDIDEGAATLAGVVDFVSRNRAERLVKRVRSIRATLQPWQDTSAVKQLDDQIHGSGLTATRSSSA